MDPAGIRDLRAALRRLARDGVTVILSSHDMAKVPYPGDSKILAPSQVPGANLPAGYLGD